MGAATPLDLQLMDAGDIDDGEEVKRDSGWPVRKSEGVIGVLLTFVCILLVGIILLLGVYDDIEVRNWTAFPAVSQMHDNVHHIEPRRLPASFDIPLLDSVEWCTPVY